MISNNSSKYKWYILALAALVNALVVSMPFMSMSVLFDEISHDLNLSLVQIGIIWGVYPFGGVLFSLIGGMLGDRFGAKLMIIVTCLLAGITGATRGMSGSFVTLTATTFLFGMATAITPTVITKAMGTWFSGRQLAFAQSVLASSMAFGFTLGMSLSATVFSPLLGGWRNVMFVYGAVAVVLGIFWLLTRSRPGTAETYSANLETVSFRRAISHVVSVKSVWLLMIVLMGHASCVQGTLGYLPSYLRDLGWTAASADTTAASFHITSLVATIPLVLLSNRLASRKFVLYTGLITLTLGVSLLSFVNGPLVLISVIIAGLFRDAFMAITVTTLLETEEVRATYAGTGLGLMLTFSRVGVVLSPPIGNSLARFGPGIPFLFWSFLGLVALVTARFLKETAKKR